MRRLGKHGRLSVTVFQEWAADWGIPPDAITDLQARLAPEPVSTFREYRSEAAVLNSIRLAAAQRGWRLFRNNVGAMQDKTGRVVRYGLANESKQMNAVVKSGDLIGWDDTGRFVSIECKGVGARTDADRLAAQQRWRDLVAASGGYAIITDDPNALILGTKDRK